MATKRPRITISLNPYVYATIKRMSELGKQPMASIVSEMLESVHEPLMRTVAFLEAAAEAPQQVKDGLRKTFETVERDLYTMTGHTIAQIDFLTEEMGKVAPSDGERAQARTAAEGAFSAGSKVKVDPPIVIRGSGSTRSGGKKPGRP